MHPDRNHVLVIGAERGIAQMLRLTLRDEGFHVVFAEDPDDARAAPEGVDVLVVDLQPSISGGRRAVPSLASRDYGVPIVVLSGDDAQLIRHQTGADAALQKPFDGEQLARVIRSVLHHRYR